MASSTGPTDVEIGAAFDRLVRLAEASGLAAHWTLRPLLTRENGERHPWAIMENGRVLLLLGYTRGGAMDRLMTTAWAFESFLTGAVKPVEAPEIRPDTKQ